MRPPLVQFRRRRKRRLRTEACDRQSGDTPRPVASVRHGGSVGQRYGQGGGEGIAGAGGIHGRDFMGGHVQRGAGVHMDGAAGAQRHDHGFDAARTIFRLWNKRRVCVGDHSPSEA